MCGILGANIEKTEKELEFCKKLMIELSIRGLHAFGFCCYDDDIYCGKKSYYKEFDDFLSLFKKFNTNKMIFHNRYSTSGDYRDMTNNQPIVINEIGAIAFNGVLTMKTKEEFEEYYKVSCYTENDGEIFLRKMEQDVEIEDFLEQEKQCSFAGVFLLKNKLFGIRNNKRPLYYYESNAGKYIVSTLDCIKRAGGDLAQAQRIKPYERCYL